jgi:hypothetical protein
MVLWCITTYFNPINYERRLKNYYEFWKSFKTQCKETATKLLTVELSIKNGKHVLTHNDADLLIQVHSNSIMWHKEQLFNIAIKNLPDTCDKICWLDCDLIFSTPKDGEDSWIKQSEKLLDNPNIRFIQPFKQVHLYDKDRENIISKMNSFAGDHKNGLSPTVGFAWGCRLKDIKDMNGFYPYNIVGGGDNLVQMILNKDNILQTEGDKSNKQQKGKRFSKKHFKHFKKYIMNCPHITKDNLKSTTNIVYHLWHGDTRNRHYADRHYILKQHNFCPEKNIILNNDGCMEWSDTTDKELKRAVKRYFESRMEDS